MGTQQILLIVLSVIIVGVAIAVGITMFRNQAYNSNQTAVASEIQSYASQVVQWYKTPASQGGRGDLVVGATGATAADIANFIGFGSTNYMKTESGEYKVTATTETTVELQGLGTEAKSDAFPLITATITFPNGTIVSSNGTGEAGDIAAD